MAGRSLWSVLMVAWLSAANAAVSPPDVAATATPAAAPERDGDASGLLTKDGRDSVATDDAAVTDPRGDIAAAP